MVYQYITRVYSMSTDDNFWTNQQKHLLSHLYRSKLYKILVYPMETLRHCYENTISARKSAGSGLRSDGAYFVLTSSRADMGFDCSTYRVDIIHIFPSTKLLADSVFLPTLEKGSKIPKE